VISFNKGFEVKFES